MPAQVNDVKRRKGHALERTGDKDSANLLSCSECRRIKVRCNRQWPCQSCVKRGCASICPNGTLMPGGPGNRYILHGSLELHQKLVVMSERIEQFEDLAREEWHTSTEGRRGEHPMLTPELLKIKQLPDTQNAATRHHASLSRNQKENEDVATLRSIETETGSGQRHAGALKSQGTSATLSLGSSEFLLLPEHEAPRANSHNSSVTYSDSPCDTVRMDRSLPDQVRHIAGSAGFSVPPGCTVTIETLIEYLPSVARAWCLCEIFFENARLHKPMLRADFVKDIFLAFYRPSSLEGILPNQNSKIAGISEEARSPGAHKLAILFSVFAIGEAADLTLNPLQNLCKRFDALAKVALCLESPFPEGGTTAFIQAIHLKLHFRSQWDQRVVDKEEAWVLFGAAVRTAFSLGLHRDSATRGFSDNEAQTRRSVFWHLFCLDCWNSLGSGRPPMIDWRYVDCKIPAEPENIEAKDGMPARRYWYQTKNALVRDCIRPVVEHVFSVEPTPYNAVQELDRRIHAFDLGIFDCVVGNSTTTGAILEQHAYLSFKEWILLHLHRTFFMHALSTSPDKPFESPYAASVHESLRCAITLLQLFRECYQKAPTLTARFGLPWTFLLTSAAVTGIICTRAPRCTAAPVAFAHLRNIVELFESSLAHSPRNSRLLPIVYRFQSQAHQSIQSVGPGLTSSLSPAGMAPGTAPSRYIDQSEQPTTQGDLLPRLGEGRKSATPSRPSSDSSFHGYLYSDTGDVCIRLLSDAMLTNRGCSRNDVNCLGDITDEDRFSRWPSLPGASSNSTPLLPPPTHAITDPSLNRIHASHANPCSPLTLEPGSPSYMHALQPPNSALSWDEVHNIPSIGDQPLPKYIPDKSGRGSMSIDALINSNPARVSDMNDIQWEDFLQNLSFPVVNRGGHK